MRDIQLSFGNNDIAAPDRRQHEQSEDANQFECYKH